MSGGGPVFCPVLNILLFNKLLNVDGHLKHLRRYVKALKRRPIAVFTTKETEKLKREHQENLLNKKNLESTNNAKKIIFKTENQVEITFEHLKNGDERFGSTVNKLKNRNYENSKILLEGVRLVSEAINQKLKINNLFFTDKKILQQLPCHKIINLSECKLYKVTDKQMKLWSETKGPAGIMAIASRPKNFPDISTMPHLPVTLIMDEMDDAGQLGTLIRSAVAACIHTILIVQGEVDPWSPKALRAGMGAHFHHPLNITQWENIYTRINNSAVMKNDNSNNVNYENINDKMDTHVDKDDNKTHIYILNTFEDGVLDEYTKDNCSVEVVNYNDHIKFQPNSFIIVGGNRPTKNLLNLLIKQSNNINNNKIIVINFLSSSDIKLNQAICGSVMFYEIKRQLEG